MVKSKYIVDKSSSIVRNKKWGALILYAIILLFFGIYISKLDISKIKDVEISLRYMLISIFFAIVYRFFGSFSWLQILSSLGGHFESYWELNLVYAKSWLGRYIPGKVTWVAGKVYFASQHGVSKSRLGLSAVLESSLQVIVAFILGSAFLVLAGKITVVDSGLRWIGGIISIVGIALFYPPLFNKILAITYKIFRGKEIESTLRIDYKVLLKSTLLFIVLTLIAGIYYFFLVKSLVPSINASYLPYLIGTIAVSGAISIAALFAPVGLGVREGVQLLFLSVIMDPGLALVVVVLARLITIGSDAIFLLLSYLLRWIFVGKK